MKPMSVLVLWALFCAAFGQGSSDDAETLLDVIRQCNDGWRASIEAKDHAKFSRVCAFEKDALFWYPTDAPPVTYGEQDIWRTSSELNRRVTWDDLQLVATQIYGDVALVYYTVAWTTESTSGERATNVSRRVTVLQRTNGQWVLVGGTIAAASPAQAPAEPTSTAPTR